MLNTVICTPVLQVQFSRTLKPGLSEPSPVKSTYCLPHNVVGLSEHIRNLALTAQRLCVVRVVFPVMSYNKVCSVKSLVDQYFWGTGIQIVYL